MNTFEKNIVDTYSDKGKVWLANLPNTISKIAADWNLSDLKPLENLSYSYVLSGTQDDKPIILKLSPDLEGLKQESDALKALKHFGVVKILAEQNGAILLERAVPGTSLKSYFQSKETESIEIACNLIKKLHQAPSPKGKFPHISEWLAALDKEWDIPLHYLRKARELRDQLLKTSTQSILLHGDLHHDNILKNGDDWIVIDPKGVLGELSYELTSFIYNPIPELISLQDAESIIEDRINHLSKELHLETQRIKEWCFLKIVLAWIWALENGIDANHFSRLLRIFNSLLQ